MAAQRAPSADSAEGILSASPPGAVKTEGIVAAPPLGVITTTSAAAAEPRTRYVFVPKGPSSSRSTSRLIEERLGAPGLALLLLAPHDPIHEVAERDEDGNQEDGLEDGGLVAHLVATEQDHSGEEDRGEDGTALQDFRPRRRLRHLASTRAPCRGALLALRDGAALADTGRRLARLGVALDRLLDTVLVDEDEVVVVSLLLRAPSTLLLVCHRADYAVRRNATAPPSITV